MIKFFSLLVVVVLIGAGCTPSQTDTLTTINGKIIVGRFSGTEKACGFAEDAQIGDSMKCNTGSITFGVDTTKYGTVWLAICNVMPTKF